MAQAQLLTKEQVGLVGSGWAQPMLQLCWLYRLGLYACRSDSSLKQCILLKLANNGQYKPILAKND